ncbi:hypothetical protein [uncultured Catenibacterium sp.]|uniref:hypothetical protein n=1 Tax=uncultured Catenibacterium sp. TaxID=286142 RepID=UPI0025913909|nr:hypothetical protein [uncultured Catenibacterium sp.]
MKILWLIALLLTSGCSTRANSNYIAQEVRTFYSGLLNGEDISITCMGRDNKATFFKEMNKNLHKKEYKDIDTYVTKKNLDVAYTVKKDNKLMRCYHGNSKIQEKQFMNYFFTMSVPVNSMDNPHVETSSFSFTDKRKVSLNIQVTKDDHYYNAIITDKKTARTYKEFKYRFDNEV